MNYYHYTAAKNAAQIHRDGWLNGSKADRLQPGWVSLTTDADCSGHGLHEGGPVPEHFLHRVEHYFVSGVPHSFDHREWRVVLDLAPTDPRLIPAYEHLDDVQIELLPVPWTPS